MMIDPSFAVDMDLPPTPPTELVLIQMKNLERALDEAREQNEKLINMESNYRKQLGDFEYRIESVKKYVMEQMDTDNIEDETAEEIASILGFELEKEVSFEVTVRFYGSVKMGPGEDAEALIGDLNYTMDRGYYSELDFEVEDVVVDQVDITE